MLEAARKAREPTALEQSGSIDCAELERARHGMDTTTKGTAPQTLASSLCHYLRAFMLVTMGCFETGTQFHPLPIAETQQGNARVSRARVSNDWVGAGLKP